MKYGAEVVNTTSGKNPQIHGKQMLKMQANLMIITCGEGRPKAAPHHVPRGRPKCSPKCDMYWNKCISHFGSHFHIYVKIISKFGSHYFNIYSTFISPCKLLAEKQFCRFAALQGMAFARIAPGHDPTTIFDFRFAVASNPLHRHRIC